MKKIFNFLLTTKKGAYLPEVRFLYPIFYMQSLEDQTQCIQAQWKMLITLKIWSLTKKQRENNFSKHLFFPFKVDLEGSNSFSKSHAPQPSPSDLDDGMLTNHLK